jgi:energy-coupling factor transporter transmembrane protein EcfT
VRDWHFPDARGWVGVSVYALAIYLITLMAFVPGLRGDEFFKTITTLVVGTAFVNGVVSWAFGATKNGGELAQKQADALTKGTDR